MTGPALKRDIGQRTRVAADAIVDDVRKTGYGTSSGGVIAGLLSHAAPIFTASDALPLAVAIVFARASLPAAEIVRGRSMPLEAAAAVSRELGVSEASTS